MRVMVLGCGGAIGRAVGQAFADAGDEAMGVSRSSLADERARI